MSRVFELYISDLSGRSGYDYDFLVDRYMEILEEDGYVDHDYFEGVTIERDW